MTDLFRISAKNLGGLALPKFCPRCFWVALKLGNKLPYQIFPGIFSSIDSYNKKIVHSYFDQNKTAPNWMSDLGELVDYQNPPHHTRFNIILDEYGINLTGSPDGVFIRPDDSYYIVDYKTAKYTGTQDTLFPMYETQLNAYALIGESCGFNPVTGLALIYFEPQTDDDTAGREDVHEDDGFIMHFGANIHEVTINKEILNPLLLRAREIYDMDEPPPSRDGCKNCAIIEEIMGLF